MKVFNFDSIISNNSNGKTRIKSKKINGRKTRNLKNISSIREGEPGINVGTSLYRQVAQICDVCKIVRTHFKKNEKLKCYYCGNILSL